MVKAPACNLPSLPPDLGKDVGFPAPDGQTIYVSKSDWALLDGYTKGIKDWIVAAAACLEAR